MRTWRWPISRRWTRRLGISAGILLVLGLVSCWVVGRVLGAKLIALMQERVNAQVSADSFFYWPPYGLSARNCRVTFTDEQGNRNDLLQIKSFRVTLAQLPTGGGPLVIQDIRVRQPVVHLIVTPHGLEGKTGLVKPPDHPDANPADGHHKLSDILRMRHVAVVGGEVVYENRTRTDESGHPVPAMKWSGIDIHIETSPKGPADYDFNFTATHSNLADLQAKGAINVDDRRAVIEHFALGAHPDGDRAASELPPELAQVLQKHRVKGDLHIEGSATADAQDPSRNTFSAVFTLADGAGYSPEIKATLDQLRFTLKATGDAKGATAILTGTSARSSSAEIWLRDGVAFSYDRASRIWAMKKLEGALTIDSPGTTRPSDLPDAQAAPRRLGAAQFQAASGELGALREINPGGSLEFTAAFSGPAKRGLQWSDVDGEMLIYPKRLSLQPRGFPLPVSDIGGGPIRVAGGVLAVKDVLGHYGTDQVLVTAARLALPPLREKKVRWSEIAATLVFGSSQVPYPPPLDELLAYVHPGGEFAASGRFEADFTPPKPLLDYDLLVSCDHAWAAVGGVEAKQIKADAELFPDHVQISQINFQALQGAIDGHGSVGTRSPFAYSGDVFTHHISVPEAAQLLKIHGNEEMKLQGQASLQASVAGSGLDQGKKALDTLTAQGQVEIYNGNLWDIPALKKIEQTVSVAREALTVGQAAALFRIADRRIELQNAAVSAPVLGLQANGFIGFDGKLDLHLIAVPLADWKKKLQKTGIPIVSDVIGQVAGTVQGALNSATGSLFYDIHVTGDASKPEVNTKPAPMLTEGATHIFKNMLDQAHDSPPIRLLQGDSNPPGRP